MGAWAGSDWATELSSWLGYGFATLAVLLCAWILFRTLVVPPDARRACCCGACHHAVAKDAGPASRCPECGASYDRVGITTPALLVRSRGGLGVALLAWTTIVGLAANQGWRQVTRSASRAAQVAVFNVKADSVAGTLRPNAGFWPQRAGADDQPDALAFRLEVSVEVLLDRMGRLIEGEAVLVLRKDGSEVGADITIDPAKQSFVANLPGEASPRSGSLAGKTDDFVRAWYTSAGIDTSHTGVRRAMQDTKKLLDLCLADPAAISRSTFSRTVSRTDIGALTVDGSWTSGGGPRYNSRAGSPQPVYWNDRSRLLAGILGGVYIAGLALIWWRHKRLVPA
ncbi:MAG TPA: hypothetical protein VD971_05580 [Phycisphaerales bacterium]|nr:hypothetical protein [Phycisphaerales bacterium]